MSDQIVSPHVGSEAMAAFVEGALAPGEIAGVKRHLVGCPDCRKAVAESARFYDEEARVEQAPSASWRRLAMAAVLAGIALLSVPVLRRLQPAPIAMLIEAAPRDHRTVEPRVAGFHWAALRSQRGKPLADPADMKLAGAAGVVLKETKGQSSAAAQHATGVAYLVIGQPSEGLPALRKAALAADDPRTWCDLAALYCVMADQDPGQLRPALDAADHALRLDPRLPEAAFNRALVLERMGRRDEAIAAWRAYLALDASSGWSAEAREHLHRLSSGAVLSSPSPMQDHFALRYAYYGYCYT